MKTVYTTTICYRVPFLNLGMILRFHTAASFWVKHPKQLDVTIKEIVGDERKMSVISNILSTYLGPLGLKSIEVTDTQTGVGILVEITKERGKT
jgi:hypothetical protein